MSDDLFMEHKLLLLDAGGVLTSPDTSARVATEIAAKSGISVQESMSVFLELREPVWDGRETEDQLWEQWWRQVGLSGQDLDAWKLFARKQVRDLPGMVSILAELSPSAQVWLLSNHCVWLRDHLRTSPMTPYLQRTFISSEIGACKPHPEAYRHVLGHWPHAPDRILFIDDKLANLEAASSLGLRTCLSDGTPDSWLAEAKSFLIQDHQE